MNYYYFIPPLVPNTCSASFSRLISIVCGRINVGEKTVLPYHLLGLGNNNSKQNFSSPTEQQYSSLKYVWAFP